MSPSTRMKWPKMVSAIRAGCAVVSHQLPDLTTTAQLAATTENLHGSGRGRSAKLHYFYQRQNYHALDTTHGECGFTTACAQLTHRLWRTGTHQQAHRLAPCLLRYDRRWRSAVTSPGPAGVQDGRGPASRVRHSSSTPVTDGRVHPSAESRTGWAWLVNRAALPPVPGVAGTATTVQ